ncbi:hypothetical protein BJX61DRAFT_515844 [Aspergillus egyptiacus]|nr:hypothetical protein BJX61DRAFT_515844 [Aspergillus egyptiacus]
MECPLSWSLESGVWAPVWRVEQRFTYLRCKGGSPETEVAIDLFLFKEETASCFFVDNNSWVYTIIMIRIILWSTGIILADQKQTRSFKSPGLTRVGTIPGRELLIFHKFIKK